MIPGDRLNFDVPFSILVSQGLGMSLQTNFSQYGIILSLVMILHTVVKYHHFRRRNCFSQGIRMDNSLEKNKH